MCKGVLEFELELKYEPRHCQEDLSLIRRGKLIAVAVSFYFVVDCFALFCLFI